MGIKYIFPILIFVQSIVSCSLESKYIFFKSEFRDQLRERAIKKCHGDFRVLEEEEFGPYSRALLDCPK